MNKTICFVGGDKRSVFMSEYFKEKGYIVKTYGLTGTGTLDEALNESCAVIGGVPFSRDSEFVSAPDGSVKIPIEQLFANMSKEQMLIAGSISDKVKAMAEEHKIKIYDLIEDEDIAVLNAIPTAEGAIDIAIRMTDITLHGANVLIMGYGRIGKILMDLLLGFHANVSVAARKDSDFAWIKTKGGSVTHYDKLNSELFKFDIVFNTVPAMMLDKDRLSILKRECVIIDLASKPGGIDFETARELGINAIWALALPGKFAPKSAAINMANKIVRLIL